MTERQPTGKAASDFLFIKIVGGLKIGVCNNVVQRLTQLWSIQIQLVICFHVTLEPRMAFTFLNG